MKEKELKNLLKNLQFLSEKDYQLIEWEIEKLRKLKEIMKEKQPQLPLFANLFDKRKYVN